MKKRILSLLLVLCMVFSMLPVTAFAAGQIASGTCGDNLTWTLDDEGTLTISGEGDMHDYSFGTAPWNDYRDQILSAVVEDGAMSIGNYAFNKCSSLVSIDLPDGLASIGENAFSGCSSLASIDLPDGLTFIDEYAFYDCSSLTSIDLPDSLTFIGYCVFEGCSSLASIDLPDRLTSINSYAFKNCSSLASIDLPDGLTSISDRAFYNCSSLTEITFTGSAPQIGINAFYGVTATAYYPAGDASWTEEVKQNYGGTITWESDDPCKDGHIEIIDDAVAATCTTPGLTEGSQCYVCGEIFIAQEEIPATGHKVVGSACQNCGALGGKCGDKLTWVLDEEGLLAISGTGAMYNWTSSSPAPWFEYGEQIKTVHIGDGATNIGNDAFYNYSGVYSNLSDITMPEGITKIGNYAFYRCTALESVQLPNTLKTIGDDSFYGCSGMTSINIPSSLTSTGFWAFYECTGLTAVHITDLTSWCKISFSYSGGNPLEYANNLYLNGELITDLVIPDGITAIGMCTFQGGSCFESISIPNSVKTIDIKAFWGCSGITELSIPSSVSLISDWAFYNCDGLTSLILPNGLKTIGENVFRHCDNLKYVYIPNTVTTIANYSGLIEGVIGNIGFYGVFTDCSQDLVIYCEAESKPSAWNSQWNHRDFDYIHTTVWGIESLPEVWPTSVSIETLPSKLQYCVGETIDLTGLTLAVQNEDGTSAMITDTDDVSIISGTTSKAGIVTVKIFHFGATAEFQITVHNCKEILQPEVSYPESAHNYANDYDNTWTYTSEGAEYLKLTFSDQTKVESNYDYIYLYDGAGNELGKYTGSALAGKTIQIPGDTVKIRLKTDGSSTYYGFSLTGIVACANGKEVFQPQSVYPESAHNYANNYNNTWTYTCEGAAYLKLTFSSQTRVESNADYIYLYDGAGNELGKYTGTSLASKTIRVSGDTVKIQLKSDGYNNYYGFSLISIVAAHSENIIHEAIDAGVYTAPGCFTDGYTTYTCFCGETFTVVAEGTAGHIPQKLEAKAPTCTETGLTEGSSCSACGEILTAQTVVGALGHSYDAVVTAPTCTEAGYTTHTCATCGDVITDTLVAALDHDMSNWVVTKESTCAEAGSQYRECSRCDYDETEAIAKLRHRYRQSVTAPTCTEDGYTTFTCDCGDSFVGAYVESLGHDYVYATSKQPKSENTGTLIGKCSRCTAEEEVVLPQLNTTDYTYVVTKEPSATEAGIGIYTWNETTYGVFSYEVEIPKLGVALSGTITSFGDETAEIAIQLIDAEENVVYSTTVIGNSAEYSITDAAPGTYVLRISKASHAAGSYTITLETANVTQDVTIWLYGDVNSDGKVNTLDRTILARYLAKWSDYPESIINMQAADVNSDGKVNTLDRTILARHLAKWTGYETLGA